MIVCHHIYLQMGWSLSAGHLGIQLGELWPLDLEKRLRIEWDMVKIVKISILPISQSILNCFASSKGPFWREFTGEYDHTCPLTLASSMQVMQSAWCLASPGPEYPWTVPNPQVICWPESNSGFINFGTSFLGGATLSASPLLYMVNMAAY